MNLCWSAEVDERTWKNLPEAKWNYRVAVAARNVKKVWPKARRRRNESGWKTGSVSETQSLIFIETEAAALKDFSVYRST